MGRVLKLLLMGSFITILVRVSIVVIKHQNQKQPGEEGFVSLTVVYNSSSSKAGKAGTQAGQELGARS